MPPKNSAETVNTSSANETRKSHSPFRIYCTGEERQFIEARAKEAGLTVSVYLRRLGLGYQPTSVIDYEVAEKIIKLSADLGRMGGLLKWWLSGTAPVMKTTWGTQVFIGEKELRSLLASIEKNQREMREQISRVISLKQSGGNSL